MDDQIKKPTKQIRILLLLVMVIKPKLLTNQKRRENGLRNANTKCYKRKRKGRKSVLSLITQK